MLRFFWPAAMSTESARQCAPAMHRSGQGALWEGVRPTWSFVP